MWISHASGDSRYTDKVANLSRLAPMSRRIDNSIAAPIGANKHVRNAYARALDLRNDSAESSCCGSTYVAIGSS